MPGEVHHATLNTRRTKPFFMTFMTFLLKDGMENSREAFSDRLACHSVLIRLDAANGSTVVKVHSEVLYLLIL